MTDIKDRLRWRADSVGDGFHSDLIYCDALCCIEKLEAALRKIIDRAEFKNSEYVTDIVCRIARDALEGKDG